MVAFSKIALAAFVGVAMASPALPTPQLGPLQLFGELKDLPSYWKQTGAVKKDAQIKAQIGLKQRNVDQLQAKLLDVSNPDSENYGKWLSVEEIDQMTAPSSENIAAVKSWLASHGITEVQQPTSDWIEFTVPVTKMESLLNTKYNMYWHEYQDFSVPRTKAYHVPKALHDMIDLITPTTAFYERIEGDVTETTLKKVSKRATCGTDVTPACIKSMYNVDYSPTGKTTVGTTKFLDVAASHSDFKTFGRTYGPGSLNDFQDVSIASGTNPGSGTLNQLAEGNLDTQYAGGLVSPNPSKFLACGPDGATDAAFNDGLANLASYLVSNANAPTAVSTSYGGPEDAYDASYLNRVCNDFMKAGARGISVFFSSGDSGVGTNGQTSCPGKFPNSWPASCPWSTAVGGTQLSGSTEQVAQYTGRNNYAGGSGGGFSSVFTAPDYQTSDTAAYQKKLGSKYSGKYNPSGRGYPDVSLISRNYDVVINGGNYKLDGTSASSPAWAALVTILNDYRVSQGKPTLGFINPLVYGSARSALRDVTTGNNRGCGGAGYSASSGWDAATGLGTVDFAKLRAML